MKNEKTTLFTVGPLEISEEILKIGANKIPYFRTKEFSEINLEICSNLKKLMCTEEISKVALLTCSGSGAMEASIINTFTKNDKLLIVDGGNFSKRFIQICEIYNINYTAIELGENEELTIEHLNKYANMEYSGLLINVHETSLGKYYDMSMVGEFCKNQNIILVVDAISSFLADEYYMDKWNIDITIISSQKALALPPGMSVVVVNDKTYERIMQNKVQSLYLDLKSNFINMERGQTPFTPAVSILMQMHFRLNEIIKNGLSKEIEKTHNLALDFRKKIESFKEELPVFVPNRLLSNAMTPLMTKDGFSAVEIFQYLVDNYGIYICPNGGQIKDKLFRVGHIGNLTCDDNDMLIKALIGFKEIKNESINICSR